MSTKNADSANKMQNGELKADFATTFTICF